MTKRRDDPTRTALLCQPRELSRFLDDQAAKTPPVQENVTNTASTGNDPLRRRPSRAPSQLSHNSSQSQPGHKHPGRVVFLRGFPSAEWLNHLGASLDVDPELFYRHLEVSNGLTPSTQRPDYCYPTPFPVTDDLMQLRVCATGSWELLKGSRFDLAELRNKCQAMMEAHLRDFSSLRNFSIGDSIVRRFTLHDLRNFSIEQHISIEVIYHTTTWSRKCGRVGPNAPWRETGGPPSADTGISNSCGLDGLWQSSQPVSARPLAKRKPPNQGDATPSHLPAPLQNGSVPSPLRDAPSYKSCISRRRRPGP